MGRGVKLTLALFLLGCSTAGIAFMPDYALAGGYAIAILAVMRIAQGIALGGTWDGLASLLAMNAPEKERGWYAMIPQLGAPLGLFVASALFVYLITGLSRGGFPRVGLALSVLRRLRDQRGGAVRAAAHRRDARSTSSSSRAASCSRRGVRETLRGGGRNILIGAFTPLATFALFHMVTVFPLSWVYLDTPAEVPALPRHRDRHALSRPRGDHRLGRARRPDRPAPAADRLRGGDRASSRWSRRACSTAAQVGEFVYMVVGFALLGLSFGQSSGAVASRFARRYRYTASALTSDLAWLFGAGFAPLVALLLASTLRAARRPAPTCCRGRSAPSSRSCSAIASTFGHD